MLYCQGFEVNHYDFTLGRLACESLQSVQNSGNKLVYHDFMKRDCVALMRRAEILRFPEHLTNN